MSFELAVFVVVYAGMIGGGLPFLRLDRTGVALLGAIALVAFGEIGVENAVRAVHLPTMILLFSFMVISAHLQLSGFYELVTRRLTLLRLRPQALLAVLIMSSALLSAIFSNDIICLAMAPILIDATSRRGLKPVPFLLGLACAANIGSAATLIGNPQNMLIGSALGLSFSGYLTVAALPVLLGLAATWLIIIALTRGQWLAAPLLDAGKKHEAPSFSRWQTIKGLALTTALVVSFLHGQTPRELVALGVAGLLLMSRTMHSHTKLGLVDWELLVLFVGLFVVHHALSSTGLPATAMTSLAAHGVDVSRPVPFFLVTFVLSNVVSNVPAAMLLLPVAEASATGATLALASTLAGNLLVVGSIANIIVVQAARERGIAIGWRTHARIGVPVTLATMLIAALCS